MGDIRKDLADIYRDFYEPGPEEPVIEAPKSPKRSGRQVKSDFNIETPKAQRRPVEPVREEQTIETEVETEIVTEDEYVAKKKKAAEDKKPKEPEKSGMEELNELIGLETVKHDVKELIGLAKVRKMRLEKGMKPVPVSLHLVFSGNPGTGKTTVARILAKLYKEIGILSEGQLVETDRAGLVAGYVGQTAIKTQKKIEEAMGGVLFIDEAYTLNQKDENFGQEAIDTILKAMEDRRDEFIVIVAGYTELMRDFVESNPGLRSRFNKFFYFPDYTVDELQQIFMMQCRKYQYALTEEAEKAARDEIVKLEAAKGENFANAREVRNLFEKIITNQAARVADLENVDDDTLTRITIEDFRDLDDLSEQGRDEMHPEEPWEEGGDVITRLTELLEESEKDEEAAKDGDPGTDGEPEETGKAGEEPGAGKAEETEETDRSEEA